MPALPDDARQTGHVWLDLSYDPDSPETWPQAFSAALQRFSDVDAFEADFELETYHLYLDGTNLFGSGALIMHWLIARARDDVLVWMREQLDQMAEQGPTG